MIIIRGILWLIFCLHPIVFIGILYSLLIGKFANIEGVNNFLQSAGVYINLTVIGYALVFICLPINFLQLVLSLFLAFKNRLKFDKNIFWILSCGLIALMTLTGIWLTPYISIIFFRNYKFGEFWVREFNILVYLLDILVPFGQLFFLYIFWQFWKIWFGKSKVI